MNLCNFLKSSVSKILCLQNGATRCCPLESIFKTSYEKCLVVCLIFASTVVPLNLFLTGESVLYKIIHFSWLCSSSTCIQSPAPLNIAADKQKTLSAKYFCLREAKEINCFSTQSHSHSELMHSIKTTPPQKYTYIIFYLFCTSAACSKTLQES